MSSLFIDTEIHLVKFQLKKVSDGSTSSFYFSMDYQAAGSIYSGSPEAMPILVSPPAIQRSVGNAVATRDDVTIELYGKVDFLEANVGFVDQLSLYEQVGGICEVRYFPKPKDALVAADDSTQLRSVTKIIGFVYDDVRGILSVQCRPVWFNDSLASKNLSASAQFPYMNLQYDGEVGAKVYGKAVSTNGVVISAPHIETGIDGSNRPYAKLFAGWTNTSYINKEKKKLFVRQLDKNVNLSEFLEVGLDANAQLKYAGNAGFTELSLDDTSRSLGLTKRMVVHHQTSDYKSRILTSIRARVRPTPKRYGAYFDGTCGLANSDVEKWRVNSDLEYSNSGCCLIRLRGKGGFMCIAGTQAGTGANQRGWMVAYDNASDRFKYYSYKANGILNGSVAEGYLGSPVVGNWYFLQWGETGSENVIQIQVNALGWTYGTTTDYQSATCRAGLRIGAAKDMTSANYLKWPLWGDIQSLAYFDIPPYDPQFTHYFNSGNCRSYFEVDPDQKIGLVSWWDLDGVDKKWKDKHGSNDLSPIGTNAVVAAQGYIPTAITPADGEMRCSIYFIRYLPTSDAYEPVGSPIRSSVIDVGDSGVVAGTTIPEFQFDPLVLGEGESYGIELSWSNTKDFNKTVLCNYRYSAGINHYAYDNSKDPQSGWYKVLDQELDLELYCVGEGVDSYNPGTADSVNSHAYQYLEARSIVLTSGQSHREFAPLLEFKIGQTGIQDDVSGSYTGTAYGSINVPALLVLFLLLGPTPHQLGLSSGAIDLTSFVDTRDKQIAAGLQMGFAVNYETSFLDLIIEICNQSRSVFYQKRDGKLAIRYWQASGAPYSTVSEAFFGGEMTLLAIADDDDSNVINNFKNLHSYDELNLSKDPALLRLSRNDKYLGYEFLNESNSNLGDLRRIANCSLSKTLYDKRENSEIYDMYDSAAMVRSVISYKADRFAFKQKRVTVRLPRRRFYGYDFFASLRFEHVGILDAAGTESHCNAYDGTSQALVYDEGVPATVWAGGVLKGQLISILEEGPFMTVTVQTESLY